MAGVNSMDSLLQIVGNQRAKPSPRTLCCHVVQELWRPKIPSPELPRRRVVAALPEGVEN